ncbi:MAG: hypothetical protein AAF674_05780 [Pseudomonadota bacterium]
MTLSYTRRRLATSLAAVSGVIWGFPTVAAECTSKDFGDFQVRNFDPLVIIRHKNQYGALALDVILYADGRVFFSITLFQQATYADGETFEAVCRFDDGTVVPVVMRKSLTVNTTSPPHHVIQAAVPPQGQLFRMFVKARKVTVELTRQSSGQLIVRARGVSLTGSSKSARYASQIVRNCLGGGRPAAGQGTGQGVQQQGCFLTTACVETLGLRDDCFELRTLRTFRDGALSATRDGRALAELYRQLAPIILVALPNDDRRRILTALYGRYILPSVIAVRLGMSGVARRIYIRGMIHLMRCYTPELLDFCREDPKALFCGGTLQQRR